MRSWEDYQDGSTNTRHVFGIRYNNAQALTRYKGPVRRVQKIAEAVRRLNATALNQSSVEESYGSHTHDRR